MAGASLAPRRYEALAYIIDRLVRGGISPSYDEISLALNVAKSRAQDLVKQLIAEGLVEKTPGALRALRVRDVTRARALVDNRARELGWYVASPLGAMQAPLPNVQLPMLPPFRHLSDAD